MPFLETTYLPEHNTRFAQAAASAEDFDRRTPSRIALDRSFIELRDRPAAEPSADHPWRRRFDERPPRAVQGART